MANDNKSTYKEHLKDFFDFFTTLGQNAIGDYPAGTFDSVSPQDGLSLWKALVRGGACKNRKNSVPTVPAPAAIAFYQGAFLVTVAG